MPSMNGACHFQLGGQEKVLGEQVKDYSLGHSAVTQPPTSSKVTTKWSRSFVLHLCWFVLLNLFVLLWFCRYYKIYFQAIMLVGHYYTQPHRCDTKFV